jgi:hypothetical protein
MPDGAAMEGESRRCPHPALSSEGRCINALTAAAGAPRPPGFNQSASCRKEKRKETKGNERKKAFISFSLLFRIGAFQWVTLDSNKKITPPLSSLLRLYAKRPRRHFPFFPLSAAKRGVDPSSGKRYSTNSGLWKAAAWQKLHSPPARRLA